MALGTLLRAEGALAKTVVVFNGSISGATNCRPDIAGTPYVTIQAALDALPNAATATNTVVVCPGIYPGQIRITKNVSITGALRDGTDPGVSGNSGESRIVPPLGGLTWTQGDFATALIFAKGVADLNLTDLAIEGTGIGCPRDLDGHPVTTAGIAFDTVGIIGSGTRGTVSKTVIHNMVGSCPDASGTPQRSYTADGILAQNSWFTLDSNSLGNIDLNAIHQIGGIGKITNNYLNYGWHGIVLSSVTATSGTAATGTTVSSNFLTTFQAGIYLDQSSDALVSLNTLLSWTGGGIVLTTLSSNNDVLSNKVVDSDYAIELINGASGNTVKSNTVIRPLYAGITLLFSDGGNQITGNTINQAPIGIHVGTPGGPGAADVINPNTFFNVTVLTARD